MRLSPRRICRNTGPPSIPVASRYCRTVRTGHRSESWACGTATSSLSPVWSVLERRIVSSSPRTDLKRRSSTSRATSSERRKAAAKPSSSRARSRRPAIVSVSIRSIIRASASSSSACALRCGPTPRVRRIPARTAAIAGDSHGLGCPWARCAAAIAAARLVIVTGCRSRSASAARNAATVSGAAGIGASARATHHSANTRQS